MFGTVYKMFWRAPWYFPNTYILTVPGNPEISGERLILGNFEGERHFPDASPPLLLQTYITWNPDLKFYLISPNLTRNSDFLDKMHFWGRADAFLHSYIYTFRSL